MDGRKVGTRVWIGVNVSKRGRVAVFSWVARGVICSPAVKGVFVVVGAGVAAKARSTLEIGDLKKKIAISAANIASRRIDSDTQNLWPRFFPG